MQRKIERYLQEVPFLTISLVLTIVAVLLLRFFVIPQNLVLQEKEEKLHTLPELFETQKTLLSRLDSAEQNLSEIPQYEILEFTDGASLINALFTIAREQNITFTKSHPSSAEGSIIVQIGFTNSYAKMGTFLTELEKYPLQLSVSQVALVRKKGQLAVSLTVYGTPNGEVK